LLGVTQASFAVMDALRTGNVEMVQDHWTDKNPQ
jgi:hypothetical protein